MRTQQEVSVPRRVKGKARGFTATYIGALEPGAREKDPAQRGLYIVTTARGDGAVTRTWQHRFTFQGCNTFVVIGHHPDTSLERARHIVQEQREQLTQGIDPRRARPRRRPAPPQQSLSSAVVGSEHSIENLAHEYLEHYVRPERKRPEYVERVLNVDVLPTWRGRDARTIVAREVVKLLDGIVGRGSKVMANRTADILDQMFRYGVQRALVDSSPVVLMMKPGGKEKARKRTLDDTEIAPLLGNLDTVMTHAPRTVAVIRLMFYTACRRSEIALARWSHFRLDGDAPLWTVPSALSKTGTEYLIPLVPEAVGLLRQLKRAADRSPFVFPNGAADRPANPLLLTRSLARHLAALERQGIKPFVLHDIRRTVRTGMSKLKIAPHIAELCLNHKQRGIVGVYDTHAFLDERREAFARWAAHLQSLCIQN